MIARRAFLTLVAAIVGGALSGCASQPPAARTFTSDRISVVTVGEGPDVVLIPGLATGRDVWDSTVAALPGHRYHLVQVHGFAGTPPRANAQPGPLLGAVASEIDRYIVEQRLREPAIVGHSLGATLAILTAAAPRSPVSRMMLVDNVPFGAMLLAGPDVTPARAASLGTMARSRFFGDGRVPALQQLYATMIAGDDARRHYLEQAVASDTDVAGRLFEEVAAADLRPQVGRLAIPITVLYVGDDKSDALYRTAYQSQPGARLTRIDGSQHFIMLDAPTRFTAELAAFLQATR
jgi:pimeloyl-ACP methyl ester carboxylesterase